MIKLLVILIFSSILSASEFQKDRVILSNEVNYPKSLILYGTLSTLLLVSNRDQSDQIQKDIYQNNTLGEYSKYGDYLGQLIPNLAYISYKHYKIQSINDKAFAARNSMFKATLYAGLTTSVLKRVFNQPRPHKGDNLSFPSGHTTTAFAFAGVVSYYENTAATVGAFAIASFVGLSRMNDNAHYLHDVVFGATIGLTFAHIFSHQDPDNQSSLVPIISGDKVGFNFQMNWD